MSASLLLLCSVPPTIGSASLRLRAPPSVTSVVGRSLPTLRRSSSACCGHYRVSPLAAADARAPRLLCHSGGALSLDRCPARLHNPAVSASTLMLLRSLLLSLCVAHTRHIRDMTDVPVPPPVQHMVRCHHPLSRYCTQAGPDDGACVRQCSLPTQQTRAFTQ
ncbi:hypothetical protein SLA2020_448980 [Shorea laevis]